MDENNLNNNKVKSNEEEKKKLLTRIKEFEYRPVATIGSTVTCCVICGILFTVIGIILLIFSSKIKDFTIRYDDLEACSKFFNEDYDIPLNTLNSDYSNSLDTGDYTKDDINGYINNLKNQERLCEVPFTLFEKMEAPVNVYYEMDNFYQNHRRFMTSFSVNQLAGKILTADEVDTDCDPIVTVEDLGISRTFGGYELSPEAPANPCGLFPKAFFNDTYSLLNNTNSTVYINETNIAWDSDKEFRFKLPPDAEKIQWINTTNEHFMVWMRPAGMNKFRKLWGRIENDMIPGNYTLQVVNNYKVSDFKGKKSFVLSTSNFLGGRNTFLATAYIILGTICLLTSAIFGVAYNNKINSDKKNL